MHRNTVQAWIDRRRVAEVSALGWSLVGPTEETCVLMTGPEIVGTGLVPLIDRAREVVTC